MLAETRTAPGAAAGEVRFVMQIWARRALVGFAAAVVVCGIAAAPDAQAQKSKSTQSEAKWIKFDPERFGCIQVPQLFRTSSMLI